MSVSDGPRGCRPEESGLGKLPTLRYLIVWVGCIIDARIAGLSQGAERALRDFGFRKGCGWTVGFQLRK